MTDSEKREAARQFYQKWVNKGKEKQDDQSFWFDILHGILGMRSNIMKGGREAGKRIEPLSKRAEGVINRLLEMYPDSAWLLPNKSLNEPIYTNWFNENLKKICKKAGVKYFSSHGIRFHNISAMYDAGINEKDIQILSGHTTANMTRYYNRKISTYTDTSAIRSVLN